MPCLFLFLSTLPSGSDGEFGAGLLAAMLYEICDFAEILGCITGYHGKGDVDFALHSLQIRIVERYAVCIEYNFGNRNEIVAAQAVSNPVTSTLPPKYSFFTASTSMRPARGPLSISGIRNSRCANPTA